MSESNQKSEATHGSTISSQKPKTEGTKASSKPWFQVRIQELESEVENLRLQLASDSNLKAQIAAKDKALTAKLGLADSETSSIPDVAWGLLWMEYFRRNKEYQFVSADGRRSKLDRYGNQWKIRSVNDLSEFEGMLETLGYDPAEVDKDDFIVLHCFPEQGPYTIACDQIEKHQKAYILAHRRYSQALEAVQEAIAKNRSDLAQKNQVEVDRFRDEMAEAETAYMQCRAVIENAIQRFYIVPMESFEKMDLYGLPVQCQSATVTPQKKYMSMPEILNRIPDGSEELLGV